MDFVNMIEKIKQEIERRVDILTHIYAEMVERKDDEMRTYYHGKIVAIEELLSFIESLEKEQETIQITPPTFAPISTEPGQDGSIVKKEQPKRKLRKVCNLREDLKADKPIEERLEELRQIRAEKDRLDEAAEEQAKSFGYMSFDYEFDENVESFKAGAKWMAEQGETVEGEIMCAVAHPHENKVVARVYGDYKFGDKVIVQIRKV